MPKASRKELRKALFKKGAGAREEAQKESKAKHETIEAEKPVHVSAPKRFILFVGNLPYNITEEEIKTHFKNCKPSSIRLRSNGICFLEFSGEDGAAQLHHALLYHHSMLKERKINVEFSAGGGGNSNNRREKIKQKNLNFQEELKTRAKNQGLNVGTQAAQPRGRAKPQPQASIEDAEKSGINPARLAALRAKR